MVVQHNLTAMNANRYLGINNSKLSKSLEKLSSGYAINRAGDNAAGLAVSEKMRSQIAGMTQGVKNAQDGISMVQTFEGALTETDSILQRMKTLADQMANGSYDDPVDRTAAEQEFLQLNDELDQIADTDFNGVIVLNGGKMADGLQQVDGLFDYANKADQVAAAEQETLKALQAEAQGKIDVATTNVKLAENTLKKTPIDMTNNGAATEYNTVDNSKYDKTAADKLWADLGIDASDATEAEITFAVKAIDNTTGKITWEVKSATSNASDKVTYTDDDLKTKAAALTITDKSGDGTNVTGKGGFVYTTTTDAINVANAVVDTKNAKVGDTVTLKFTNAASEKYAPANIGMDKDSLSNTAGIASPVVTIGAAVKDSAMTEKLAEDLKKLDSAKVIADYQTDGSVQVSLEDDKGLAVDGLTIVSQTSKLAATASDAEKTAAAGKYDIIASDGKTVLATVSGLSERVQSLDLATTGASKDVFNKGDIDAGGYMIFDGSAWKAYKADGTDSTATLALPTASAGNNFGKTYAKGDRIDVGDPDDLSKITFTPAEGLGTGRVEFGVAVESFKYSEDGGVSVSAGKDKTIDSDKAVAAQKALEKAQAELKAAQDAYPTELPKSVSKSDAFDKSEAKLTYKESITLQTGARTKDAVNFTFTYNSDAIGDLKADLNCTAEGLGTSKLTLKTQEDANYAIDKIDQAINKVSLVRGTFGAIQNRLEHKIDNMNVSIENLTSAESQIRDTNMPEEMMNFTKQQILAQASQSMLAQANQLPQSVLSLLQ